MMPSQAQIDAVLADPDSYSEKLVNEAKRLSKQQESQATPTVPNPTVDPITGAPTGGAPGAAVNFMPSALNFGNSMYGGIGNFFSNPVETIKGIPEGIAQHYGERYSSPEAAMNTFQSDPFGAVMDVVPVGSALRLAGWGAKGAGLSNAGNVAGQVGRGLERLDPAGVAVGAVQGTIGAGMNKIMPNRTPEAVMAGTEYGGPQGRQQQYLTDYYDDVGRALDEGYGNTLDDVNRIEGELAGARTGLNEILDANSNIGINKAELVRQIMELKTKRSANLDPGYMATIEKAITEVLGDVDSGHQLTPSELNKIKSDLQGKVNWEAVDAPGLEATQAYADSSRVLRNSIREKVPGVAPALDEYTQLSTVDDIVRRGHIQNLPAIGGGTAGSFLAQGVDLMAPILTGQGKTKRNQIRRNMREGRVGSTLTGLTDRSVYGPIREGAYLSEMERNADPKESDTWTVGRLWSE
jgi:hypothetical protein